MQNTRFYRKLNCEALRRAGGLNASNPVRTNWKWILLPKLGATRKQKMGLFSGPRARQASGSFWAISGPVNLLLGQFAVSREPPQAALSKLPR
jgi:hypothetical protein